MSRGWPFAAGAFPADLPPNRGTASFPRNAAATESRHGNFSAQRRRYRSMRGACLRHAAATETCGTATFSRNAAATESWHGNCPAQRRRNRIMARQLPRVIKMVIKN
jgi:hypothetical protein